MIPDNPAPSPEPRAPDDFWMSKALQLARQAAEQGEVPVGALVVLDGNCIGEGWNQPITLHDPCAHAEIMALRAAGASLQNYRLPGATLYVTLEPCAMCAGAMVHARIRRLVYAAADPKSGAAGSCLNVLQTDFLNHRSEITVGVMAAESRELLQRFFAGKRTGP